MNLSISSCSIWGHTPAPPSKSHAHRLIIAASLSSGISILQNVGFNDDIRATLACVEALGARYRIENDTLTIQGIPSANPSPKQREDARKTVELSGQTEQEEQTLVPPCAERMPSDAPLARQSSTVLPCNESGSTLRFMLPISLALKGEAHMVASARLVERGINVYEEALEPFGVSFEMQPQAIYAKGLLKAGDYQLRGNVSSQFVTGLLFALPLTGKRSTIRLTGAIESRPYIDLSLAVLREAGIHIEEASPGYFIIPAGQHYHPLNTCVEGDWSNAAFLLAFNYLPPTDSSRISPSSGAPAVTVSGLSSASLQADKVCIPYFEAISRYASSRRNTSGTSSEPSPESSAPVLDLSFCPDLAPVLFAVAAAWEQGAHFIGTHRLAIKESNRAEAMKAELAKFGIEVLVRENSVDIRPGKLHRPQGPLFCHNDHRIAMALSILATRTSAVLEGTECVAKSFPHFFALLEELHGNISADTQG